MAERPIDHVSFNVWYNSLKDLDKRNLATLLSLPGAYRIISDMPEGKYKGMAGFALAVQQTAEDSADGGV